MKKWYLFLLLSMLLFSCTNDFNESIEIHQKEHHNTVSNMKTNSVSVNLSDVVTQLVTSYKQHIDSINLNNTLLHKIILLEEITNENANFIEIKPVWFSAPTVEEAQKFLINYDIEYNNLNVSPKVENYFNTLLEGSSDVENLLYDVNVDEELNADEKSLLLFTINCLNDHSGNGDNNWKKRMIVAAISGFELSSANAVFNVTLLNIIH